jgi:hypothetical protein
MLEELAVSILVGVDVSVLVLHNMIQHIQPEMKTESMKTSVKTLIMCSFSNILRLTLITTSTHKHAAIHRFIC